MYLKWFELNENPFGITPDPKYFYLSKNHETAVEWIKYAIEQHEFALVYGEVGSGKTVVSRYVIDSLDEKKYKVCWIINPNISPLQFLKEIYSQLFDEVAPHRKVTLLKKFGEKLSQFYLDNIYPVVFVDEGQAISYSKIFEELRLLSNFQTDKQNLISFIFMGQLEIISKLKKKVHKPFLQRIRYTLELKGLSEEDTKNYIAHRLKVAGAKKNFFNDEAVKEIHKLSKGYPRPVNHICSFALMEAVSREKKEIDADIIKDSSKSILYL